MEALNGRNISSPEAGTTATAAAKWRRRWQRRHPQPPQMRPKVLSGKKPRLLHWERGERVCAGDRKREYTPSVYDTHCAVSGQNDVGVDNTTFPVISAPGAFEIEMKLCCF